MYVSAPLRSGEQIVGAVLAGNNMDALTAELQGSAVAQVAVYGADAQLLQTSLELNDITRQALVLDTALQRQALATDGRNVPVRSLTMGGVPYRAAYAPLNYGQSTPGVVAVLIPDNLPFATGVARQLTAIMAAGITGMAVAMVFVGVAFMAGRTQRVQNTAEALAAGHKTARTHMQPVDEAGAAGAALDQYANRVLREQNVMQQALQRQRRETNHLAAVLTALPDGVIVQDTTGNLTFVNESARRLLNTSTNIQENFARMVQKIRGDRARHPLAPGLYAIGDPQRIEMGERMLNAQAAAITSVGGEQVGTVIVMRDMTDMVQQEQKRERLLQAVEEQVQSPLMDIAQASAFDDTPLDDFTREITKRAVALQKLVVEMREITTVDASDIQQSQKQIRLDTFIWAVANEWRQIAQAAGLQFYVSIDRSGLHILGEERRLRWAVGNIIDNAIKYTPPGGAVTLEVNGESRGQALMRVRDNGAGIAAEELPRVTTRFYRGNPVTQTGAIIRTPGMGQGLFTAEQIFKAHGGFLRVRSKPGTGTAVYFSLPVTSAQSLDLPRLVEDFEGETVRLPENQFPDLRL
ncbi:MAG: ATP-binding protein [Chloroflexota bacterium]